jgi:cyanate lyase
MTREQLIPILLAAKRQSGLSFKDIAQQVGRHPVWTASVIYGQNCMDVAEAQRLLTALGLQPQPEMIALLTEPALRGALDAAVPVDPLIYRLHEITQIYGTTIKALIHEEFGDGIMSAIDFELDIERIADPKGDRVKLIYNGKFLPYRKW